LLVANPNVIEKAWTSLPRGFDREEVTLLVLCETDFWLYGSCAPLLCSWSESRSNDNSRSAILSPIQSSSFHCRR